MPFQWYVNQYILDLKKKNNKKQFSSQLILKFTHIHPYTYTQLGFINALAFSNDGTKLIVGIGQEHRLGRWFKPLKFAKNGLKIIPLLETSPQE